MVNFEWYRSFVVIYKTGTITAAAKELLISQPNVSQHLVNLESYVGHKLFERTARKVFPTEYGKQLYIRIIESVEKLEHTEATFRKSNFIKFPTLYLGSPREFFYAQLADKLNNIEESLYVEFGLTSDLIKRLEKNELNFVIATQHISSKDIVYEPFFDETLLLIANINIKTEEFTKLLEQCNIEEAEKWLAKQNWIAYSYDLALIKRFWHINFNRRPSIKLKMIIPDLQTITKIMETQKVFSILPDYLVRNQLETNSLKSIWQGPKSVSNTLYLAYKKDKATPVMLETIKAILK